MLIVETGEGVANAESLCSVAFFRDYHAKRGTDTAMIAEEIVEQLLRKATDYIKYRFGEFFAGVPYFVDQPLPFPRRPSLTVPLPIVEATAELALIARTTPLMPTITRGKKKVKVGPLEVEYDGAAATAPKFVSAAMRIAAYVTGAAFGGGVNVSLVRS